MNTNISLTDKNNGYFTLLINQDLAKMLSGKIVSIHPQFQSESFNQQIAKRLPGQSFKERILTIAEELNCFLPDNFEESWDILSGILGPVNPNQTGMFTHWYWLMPIAKYVEVFGVETPQKGLEAISEITKRNTGEFAVRPYIRRYPELSLKVMEGWSTSSDFHLRRLASEGLRPKLPWATKLDTFINTPEPVFNILAQLNSDEILFVKKSVANHLTDWLRVNPAPTRILIEEWKASANPHTQWIIRRATRKIS